MLETRLTGARTHNLKGVSLRLAPGEFVAIAGVSGAKGAVLVGVDKNNVDSDVAKRVFERHNVMKIAAA
jgi:excinuclease UvrABC ATPase subunit